MMLVTSAGRSRCPEPSVITASRRPVSRSVLLLIKPGLKWLKQQLFPVGVGCLHIGPAIIGISSLPCTITLKLNYWEQALCGGMIPAPSKSWATWSSWL